MSKLLDLYADFQSLKLSIDEEAPKPALKMTARINNENFALGFILDEGSSLTEQDLRKINTLFRAGISTVAKEHGVIAEIDAEIQRLINE